MNNKKLFKSVKNVLASMILFVSPQLFFNSAKADPVIVSTFNEGAANTSGDATGFVAGGATFYSVDVFWSGDMTFIFDNGIYSSATGTVVSSLPATSEDPDEITQAMAEKNVSAGTIKKWYGFDGLRNRIVVLNRSNADITAAYEPTTTTASFVGNNVTALHLYDYAANNSPEGYSLQIAQSNVMDESETPQVVTAQGYPTNLGDDTDSQTANRFGSGTELVYDGTPTNVKTLKGAVANSEYMYANKIFFNITGTPASNFPIKSATQSVDAGSIGTITITFEKAPVTP